MITKKKYLTDAECLRLERRLKSLSDVEPRNSALILLGIYTGARAQELLNLRPEDLDPNEMSVYIRGLKRSNDRVLPLPEWLFLLLVQVSGEERVFEISYPRLDQIWHSLRTVSKKFHALRHTFAIRLYKQTKNIIRVKNALGHKQLSSTMVYTDYVDSIEEMRKAMEPLWHAS